MARPIVLGNGDMLVGLDNSGQVHDFYYPYIDENHANARHIHHRIGVWIDGVFSWLEEDAWQISLDYQTNSLVGQMVAKHERLQVSLKTTDFVDTEEAVFARKIEVTNHGPAREIRLFLHQLFQVSDSNRGETAQYHPRHQVVVHYKGRRAFAAYAESAGKPFDQFSIGLYATEGKEGTYKDAEDGELDCNAVEYGLVDSVLRLPLKLAAGATTPVNYWVAAARHTDDALKLHHEFKAAGLQSRLNQTKAAWREWLAPANKQLSQMPDVWREPLAKSAVLIKSHIDNRGGVLASGDSETLNYGRDYYYHCWPRDAYYALRPLVRMGYLDEAKAYLEFAGRVRHRDGYLMQKYRMDGAVGSSWHPYIQYGQPALPIQEDETAAAILLMRELYLQSSDDHTLHELYQIVVKPAASFLASYIDPKTGLPLPSYELWELDFGTHTYTVATVYAALRAASELAMRYGTKSEAKTWARVASKIQKQALKTMWNPQRKYFFRTINTLKSRSQTKNPTIDIASLYGAVEYGLLDENDPRLHQALDVALEHLKVETIDGPAIGRFEGDGYSQVRQGVGNPWIITTLWAAQICHRLDRGDEARRLAHWVLEQMSDSGVLPEQINPVDGSHISVSPLVWSQAELITTILELHQK
jgi:GH15 family glucan-1,4-alpha-glucosidase